MNVRRLASAAVSAVVVVTCPGFGAYDALALEVARVQRPAAARPALAAGPAFAGLGAAAAFEAVPGATLLPASALAAAPAAPAAVSAASSRAAAGTAAAREIAGMSAGVSAILNKAGALSSATGAAAHAAGRDVQNVLTGEGAIRSADSVVPVFAAMAPLGSAAGARSGLAPAIAAAPAAAAPAPQNLSPDPENRLTWLQFFSGVGAAAFGAPIAGIGHTATALWYAPQAYWYGYRYILASKKIGPLYKLGYAFLLTLGVPLTVALTPVAGLMYGLIGGFTAGRKTGFVSGIRQTWDDVRKISDALASARRSIQDELAREKQEPGGKRKDLTVAQLASGVAGAVAALIPLPVPATLLVFAQSPRVVFYGLRALWRMRGMDFKYKLAITLLFPVAYALVIGLAFPAAALWALGSGFYRGWKEGPLSALKNAWKDVRWLNEQINSTVDDFKNSRGVPRL